MEDVRASPLARRKAVLKRLAKGARRWIALVDGVPGQGRRLFVVVRMSPTMLANLRVMGKPSAKAQLL